MRLEREAQGLPLDDPELNSKKAKYEKVFLINARQYSSISPKLSLTVTSTSSSGQGVCDRQNGSPRGQSNEGSEEAAAGI
jgi:hypothetical protein